MVRATLTLMVVTAAVCLAACGRMGPHGNASRARETSQSVYDSKAHAAAVPPGGYLRGDGDTDPDDQGSAVSNDDQQEMVTASRHGANRQDRQAVTATIKRYLAAAAIGDARLTCSLLTSSLAASVAAEGQRAASVASCPAAMAVLLGQQHEHLAREEIATMIVTGVHVGGDMAFTTLGFRKAIESEMLLQREGRRWRVNSLFDSALP